MNYEARGGMAASTAMSQHYHEQQQHEKQRYNPSIGRAALKDSTHDRGRRRLNKSDSIRVLTRKIDRTAQQQRMAVTTRLDDESDHSLSSALEDAAEWGEETVAVEDEDAGKHNITESHNIVVGQKMISSSSQHDDDAKEESKSDDANNRKKVTFGMAHTHEHPMIVGDNPSCVFGVPITIDWKRIRMTVTDLSKEQHMAENDPDNHNGGCSEQKEEEQCAIIIQKFTQMRLTAREREDKMRDAGYSKKELIRLCKPVNIARAQRKRTLETMPMHPIHEIMERATKGFKKCMLINQQERNKRELCKQWSNQVYQASTTNKVKQ